MADRLMDVVARIRFVVVDDAGADAVDATQVKLTKVKAKLIDGAGDDQSVIADGAAILNVETLASADEHNADGIEKALRSLSRCAFVLRKIAEGDHKALENASEAGDEAVAILLDLGRRDLWDEEPGDDEDAG